MPKIKKIVLIETKSPGLHVFSAAKLPRIGIAIIATILHKNGYKVKAYCEDLSAVDFNEIKDADLVGISAITSTSTRSYKLITEIKKINPDVPIVTGGPHPTFLPEEVLENGSDFAVRGEGEKTILELIDAIEGKINFADVKGLSFKNDGIFIHNKDRELIENLDDMPFPDWSLIDNSKEINYIPIQTSRGCPYNCKFCTVVKVFGRKYRFRSVESVISEIKYLLKTFEGTKAKRIFFYDDNFSANKKRTKSLLTKILEQKINMPTWFSQERLEIAKDEELLDLMVKTGCKRIMAGIESINPETLKEYNKHQEVEEIKESIQKLHKHGIGVHGMFVLGGEHDDIDSIKKTMSFIIENKIDTVQIMMLIPFPGTEIYEEYKKQGRIIFDGAKNWYLYDGHHVVFQPNLIAPWDLQAKVSIDVLSSIYSYYRALSFIFQRQIVDGLLVIYSNKIQKQWTKLNKDFLENIKNIHIGPYSLAKNI
ncbi:MAG: B12-binding domain-containing radical SAM protein [Actinobacteria bacterium]|nr:B12-binding domain-containing radical SAM protein [Actinomycetota bacterium]